MRRWLAIPLLFASALALLFAGAPRAAAQPKGDEESITTADGFRLRGVFHKSAKAADTSPVVILLYAPGPDQDMSKGEWGVMIKQLTEAGFHVFQFDWRGHGKSKDIIDTNKFWNLDGTNGFTGTINNKYIKDSPAKKKGAPKDEFSVKDFTSAANAAAYLPVYVNDLAAVRLHLDKKNDNSKVNTTSIYLIGVGDAAAIGMAWIYAEWNRPSVAPMFGIGAGAQTYAFVPQLRPNLIKTPAGNDIAAAIWISPTVPKAFPKATLQNWVRDPVAKLRTTPMMFLVGDKDETGKRDAETYFRDVLVARPPKGSSLNDADKTYLLEIKGGGQQRASRCSARPT